MASKYSAFCKNCQEETIHERPSTSHVLHLLLSVITVGLWIPVWILVAMSNGSQGVCLTCAREVGLFGSGGGGVRNKVPSPDTHVKCPDCAELVKREARVCRHCGCKLVPQ